VIGLFCKFNTLKLTKFFNEDMSELLQSFIQEIVNSTKLKGRIEHELLRELTSHILEEEKELQLQGYSEEKITSIIIERFGDWQTIARELYITHWTNKHFKYSRLKLGNLIPTIRLD
jgi:hypothetical protein